MTATISGALENGPLTNNTITSCTTMAPLANLYITKTMNPFTGFAAGSIVSYTINYGNSGGAPISGVVITDILPSVLSANQTVRNIPALQPGQTGSIMLTGTLNTTLTGGTTFVNTATIQGNGLEFFTGNNSSSVTGTVALSPNISLDIQANNITRPALNFPPHGSGMNIMIQAVSGDIVVLTINYGNNGNMNATGAMLALAGLTGLHNYGTFN